jgi:hypothetical protein
MSTDAQAPPKGGAFLFVLVDEYWIEGEQEKGPGRSPGQLTIADRRVFSTTILERGTGIEPVFQAWEARVEPIN